MKKLLSGNEATALGAYMAGVSVAAAYPGTPSTEILEEMSRFSEVYSEWAPNEKVALEVALGAAYTGVRAMASMKMVGLNVAADPFFAASQTGVPGGLVIITADDPGMHSSQNEQDNRHFAKFAKVPLLEPADSEECFLMMRYGFEISEQFDTPVLFRTTTRVAHSKSVLDPDQVEALTRKEPNFERNAQKYVMIPAHARRRHPLMEERLVKLAGYAETFPLNKVIYQDRKLGIITSGISYQYAREVFPNASFLKLGLTFPLPERMIREFAASVERVLVVEDLDPILEEGVRLLGVNAEGKKYFSIIGELSVDLVDAGGRNAGVLAEAPAVIEEQPRNLPIRPPVLCAGCPHAGVFYTLRRLGFGDNEVKVDSRGFISPTKSNLIVSGDIGCYTLGVLPPLSAIDTTTCMGASIGGAMGMQKAGVKNPVVAVIGDSTFIHSGITPLIDVVYNKGAVTTIILDNSTTAMTGHQEHPGTGKTACGEPTAQLDLERLVRGIVDDVRVVDAFDIPAVMAAITETVQSPEPSVVIAKGPCVVKEKVTGEALVVDIELCNGCLNCIKVGCPALSKKDKKARIEVTMCVGENCTVCRQVCPQNAIGAKEEVGAR